jgi:hypothetical protein
MKKSTATSILNRKGIKVVDGKIAKADIEKARMVLASDKSVTKQNVEFEDIGDQALTVTIDEIEFNFDHESDYGADADGNRGRSAWFLGDVNYEDPTHGKDENGNLVPLNEKDLKDVHEAIEKMAEDVDIND